MRVSLAACVYNSALLQAIKKAKLEPDSFSEYRTQLSGTVRGVVMAGVFRVLWGLSLLPAQWVTPSQ